MQGTKGCARVLRDLKRLGLHVELADGQPVLCGPRAKATPALLAQLKVHREEIVQSLTPPPLPEAIEWLLPTGVVLCRLLRRPPDAPEIRGRDKYTAAQASIPYGALLWRVPGGFWQLLKTLPSPWGLAVLKRRSRKARRLTGTIEDTVTGEEP